MISIEGCPGNIDVFNHIKSIAKRTKRGASNAFLHIGPDVINDARADMSKPKNGIVYKVFWSKSGRKLKRGRLHKASKRGEAPAILSGRLFRSLGFNRKTFTTLTIGSKVEHSQWLEPPPDAENEKWTGYLDRPFLLKAINNKEKNTENYLLAEMQRELLR